MAGDGGRSKGGERHRGVRSYHLSHIPENIPSNSLREEEGGREGEREGGTPDVGSCSARVRGADMWRETLVFLLSILSEFSSLGNFCFCERCRTPH